MNLSTLSAKRIFVLIFAIVVTSCFMGTRGLFETSEGRYAECAREMFVSGDYLEPTLGYQPHWTKPPITYWAMAAGMKLLGPNEWGLRLFNIVAFVLTVLAITECGRLLFDENTGFMAGIIYTTSAFPAMAASVLTTDTLLTFWITMAVYSYLQAWKISRVTLKNNKTWIITMWLFLGLAFATKGPPGLLVLAPIIIWNRRQQTKPHLFPFYGLLGFALTAFSWYIIVCLRNEGLFSYLIHTEVLGRVKSDNVHNHAWYKSFSVYAAPLILGAGIWSAYGINQIWRRRLFGLKKLYYTIKDDKPASFLLLWCLIPLSVMLVAASKLALYILPYHAPMIIALSACLAGDNRKPTHLRNIIRVSLATGIIIIMAKAAGAYTPSYKNMKQVYEHLCKPFDNGNTSFSALDSGRLFGLQFYLNGNLKRISLLPNTEWTDNTLDNELDLFEQTPDRTHTLLVYRKRPIDVDFDDLLKRHDFDIYELKYLNWSLYVIPPAINHHNNQKNADLR